MSGQHRAIGVDVGGTKILAGVVGHDGDVARRDERPTPRSSEDDLIAELASVVEGLMADDVAAVGFGLPSTIDQRSGRAVSSVHIPIADIDIRSRMADRIGLPVAIENDANAAAIAEWKLGAGRGASHIVALTLGTGIGGGLILDGRPYRGSVGAGGELGHLVLSYGGPPCGPGCSGRGHIETLASGTAADNAARRRLGSDADARDLVAAASEGDAGALEDLAEIGRRLGAGIASLVNIFNPELVILGGGFASAWDFIVPPARETLAVEALEPGRDLVSIVPAEFGPEAGMVGAALVAFEALDVGL